MHEGSVYKFVHLHNEGTIHFGPYDMYIELAVQKLINLLTRYRRQAIVHDAPARVPLKVQSCYLGRAHNMARNRPSPADARGMGLGSLILREIACMQTSRDRELYPERHTRLIMPNRAKLKKMQRAAACDKCGPSVGRRQSSAHGSHRHRSTVRLLGPRGRHRKRLPTH